MVCAGTEGWMATAPHEVDMRATVRKSLSGSNGIGCRWRVIAIMAIVVARKV
jgi:hypothetical protein